MKSLNDKVLYQGSVITIIGQGISESKVIFKEMKKIRDKHRITTLINDPLKPKKVWVKK